MIEAKDFHDSPEGTDLDALPYDLKPASDDGIFYLHPVPYLDDSLALSKQIKSKEDDHEKVLAENKPLLRIPMLCSVVIIFIGGLSSLAKSPALGHFAIAYDYLIPLICVLGVLEILSVKLYRFHWEDLVSQLLIFLALVHLLNFFNCHFASKTSEQKEVMVTRKQIIKDYDSPDSYRFEYLSWEKPVSARINVKKSLYDKAEAGKSKISLTVKHGFLSYDIVTAVNLLEGNNSPN